MSADGETAVDPAVLRSTGEVWQGQGEQLRGAGTSLADVEPDAVGERAAGALETFATHWAERVRGLETTSQRHGSALREAAVGFEESDRASAAELARVRGLLERPT